MYLINEVKPYLKALYNGLNQHRNERGEKKMSDTSANPKSELAIPSFVAIAI